LVNRSQHVSEIERPYSNQNPQSKAIVHTVKTVTMALSLPYQSDYETLEEVIHPEPPSQRRLEQDVSQ